MRQHHPHLVIGFTGRVGSGKTSCAKALLERFRFRRPAQVCHHVQFSEPLKAMLAVVGVEKGEQPGEVSHPSFRDTAQHIGCWMRNNVSDLFWVDIARARIEGMNAPTVAIFSDVRFSNEAALCDLVVRLVTHRDTGLAGYQMVHESERHWETIPAHMEMVCDEPRDIEAIGDAVYGRAVELLERN